MRFYNLVDLFLKLLSATDITVCNITKECRHLMASKKHGILLFGEKTLEKLNTCKSYFLLKIILLPYMTWFDHSLLKHLVLASESEVAVNLLEEFQLSIDFTQPITSYPIPTPSQLIIPLATSGHTLVATKHIQCYGDIKLEEVNRIKLVLIKMWQITEYSIQLVAIDQSLFYLYWLIPKSLVSLIEEQISFDEIQNELLEEGVIMATIFPKEIFAADNTIPLQAIATGPFKFLSTTMQGNVMVRCMHTNV